MDLFAKPFGEKTSGASLRFLPIPNLIKLTNERGNLARSGYDSTEDSESSYFSVSLTEYSFQGLNALTSKMHHLSS